MQEEAREHKKSRRRIRAPSFQSFFLIERQRANERSSVASEDEESIFDPSKREPELRALGELPSQKAFQLPVAPSDGGRKGGTIFSIEAEIS